MNNSGSFIPHSKNQSRKKNSNDTMQRPETERLPNPIQVFNEEPKSIFPNKKASKNQIEDVYKQRGMAFRNNMRSEKETELKIKSRPLQNTLSRGKNFFPDYKKKNNRAKERDSSECSISGDLKSGSSIELEGRKGFGPRAGKIDSQNSHIALTKSREDFLKFKNNQILEGEFQRRGFQSNLVLGSRKMERGQLGLGIDRQRVSGLENKTFSSDRMDSMNFNIPGSKNKFSQRDINSIKEKIRRDFEFKSKKEAQNITELLKDQQTSNKAESQKKFNEPGFLPVAVKRYIRKPSPNYDLNPNANEEALIRPQMAENFPRHQQRASIYTNSLSNQQNSILISKSSSRNFIQSISNTIPFSSSRSGMINPSSGSTVRRSSGAQNSTPRNSGVESIDVFQFRQGASRDLKSRNFVFGQNMPKGVVRKNNFQFPFKNIDSRRKEHTKTENAYLKMKTTGHSLNFGGLEKSDTQNSFMTLKKGDSRDGRAFFNTPNEKRMNFSQQYSLNKTDSFGRETEPGIRSLRLHPSSSQVEDDSKTQNFPPLIKFSSSRENNQKSNEWSFQVRSYNSVIKEENESPVLKQGPNSNEYLINIAKEKSKSGEDEYLVPPNINSNPRFLQYPNPNSQNKIEGGRKSLFHNANFPGMSRSFNSHRRNTQSVIRSILTEQSDKQSHLEHNINDLENSKSKLFSMSSVNDGMLESSHKFHRMGSSRGLTRVRPRFGNQCSLDFGNSRRFGAEGQDLPGKLEDNLKNVYLEKVNEEKFFRSSRDDGSYYTSQDRDSKKSNRISKYSSKKSYNITTNLKKIDFGADLKNHFDENMDSEIGSNQSYYERKIFEFREKKERKGNNFKYRHSLPNPLSPRLKSLSKIKESAEKEEMSDNKYSNLHSRIEGNLDFEKSLEAVKKLTKKQISVSKDRWTQIHEICKNPEFDNPRILQMYNLQQEKLEWERKVQEKQKDFNQRADYLLRQYECHNNIIKRHDTDKQIEDLRVIKGQFSTENLLERARQSEKEIRLDKRERMLRQSQNQNERRTIETRNLIEKLYFKNKTPNPNEESKTNRFEHRKFDEADFPLSQKVFFPRKKSHSEISNLQTNPKVSKNYDQNPKIHKLRSQRNFQNLESKKNIEVKRKVRTINEFERAIRFDPQNYKRIKQEDHINNFDVEKIRGKFHYPNKTYSEFRNFDQTNLVENKINKNRNFDIEKNDHFDLQYQRKISENKRKEDIRVPSKETMPTLGQLKSGNKKNLTMSEMKQSSKISFPKFDCSMQNFSNNPDNKNPEKTKIMKNYPKSESSIDSDEIITSNYEEPEKSNKKAEFENSKKDNKVKKRARIGRLIGRNIKRTHTKTLMGKFEKQFDLRIEKREDSGLQKRKSKRLAKSKIKEKIMKSSQTLRLNTPEKEKQIDFKFRMKLETKKNFSESREKKKEQNFTDSEPGENDMDSKLTSEPRIRIKKSESQSKVQIIPSSPQILQNLERSEMNTANDFQRTSPTPNLISRVDTQPRRTRRATRRKKNPTTQNLSELIKQIKQTPTKPKKGGCKCKRSKCLKMYCECFANDRKCRKSCKCVDCCNNTAHELLRSVAKREILAKDPNAFANKIKKLKGSAGKLNVRGCKCQKTRCLKKYCECFSAGIGCTVLCQCKNCGNKKLEIDQQEAKDYFERPQRRRRKGLLIFKFFAERVQSLEKEEEMREMNEKMRLTLGRIRQGLEDQKISGDELRKCVKQLGLSKEFEEYEKKKMLQLRGLADETGAKRG